MSKPEAGVLTWPAIKPIRPEAGVLTWPAIKPIRPSTLPPPSTPIDALTLADLQALAELIIADAVLHCTGEVHQDLEHDIEAEVAAMFAEDA